MRFGNHHVLNAFDRVFGSRVFSDVVENTENKFIAWWLVWLAFRFAHLLVGWASARGVPLSFYSRFLFVLTESAARIPRSTWGNVEVFVGIFRIDDCGRFTGAAEAPHWTAWPITRSS